MGYKYIQTVNTASLRLEEGGGGVYCRLWTGGNRGIISPSNDSELQALYGIKSLRDLGNLTPGPVLLTFFLHVKEVIQSQKGLLSMGM